MTPFNQVLRLWLRRASGSERALALCAAVLASSLLAWALLPVNATPESVRTTPVLPTAGGASGAGAASETGGASGAAGASDSPQSSGDGASPPGSATRSDGGATASAGSAATGPVRCPTGTAQGVTDTEMHVAFSLIDVGGQAGNGTFGLPSADEQRSDYDIVTKAVNDSGGICGRKVIGKYYAVNAFDSSAPHQTCLEITADKPFFVFDSAIGSNEVACFAQHQTPVMPLIAPAQDARRYYPYVNAPLAYDLIYRNAVFAWMRAGKFNDGGRLGKIGVIFHSCVPLYQKALFEALRDAGVPNDHVSAFDFGDCSGFASPSTHQEAILQFRRDGVTHLLVGFMSSDFSNFTRIAQQQGFKPQYRIADQNTLSVAYGSLAPDWDNLDGSTAITELRFGEEHTPDYRPAPSTQECDAVFTAAGRPPTYQQPSGWGGYACFYLWSLKAAVEHAPDLSAAGVAAGFSAAGTVPDPYPLGPTNYGPGELWGGRFWREIKASASCRCYRIVDPEFRPSFP